MPTVTVEDEKSFEREAGKKLVLAIEDAGIDIMHRCGGNAPTTCRVQVISGDLRRWVLPRRPAWHRGQPGPGHPARLPDPG